MNAWSIVGIVAAYLAGGVAVSLWLAAVVADGDRLAAAARRRHGTGHVCGRDRGVR